MKCLLTCFIATLQTNNILLWTDWIWLFQVGCLSLSFFLLYATLLLCGALVEVQITIRMRESTMYLSSEPCVSDQHVSVRLLNPTKLSLDKLATSLQASAQFNTQNQQYLEIAQTISPIFQFPNRSFLTQKKEACCICPSQTVSSQHASSKIRNSKVENQKDNFPTPV
jgi:hypothetical protein